MKRRSSIASLSSDDSEGVTPVPIPNTEVKSFSVDGTWRATAWESRTLLVSCSKVAQRWSTRLLTDRLRVRIPPLEPYDCRGGGTGRRTGLKILRSLPIVPVRFRSSAPYKLNIAEWSSWQLVGLITQRS